MEPEQLFERRQKVQIVDVRTPHEWRAGRIEQAHHIPMDELPDRLVEIGRASTVVTVCRSGSRSGKMAHFLEERGYQVENLAGGLLAWQEAGLSLVSDQAAPQVVEE
ncbi:MAG: rhodanese-like domain-containing protein [Candidatus Dormibacteraeota bacterium]|nr:rhodanese-like domain-containing protein [Candidatus Dormibacteraeota bacterium]